MSDQDPAFLWETEALRMATPRARRRGAEAPRPPRPPNARPSPESAQAEPPVVSTLTTPATEGPPAAAPPGTLIVPLDAWEKTLRQLGNLYEAGQQLADASARAAKAETEAQFLRERVRELRDELRSARIAATPEPADETLPADATESPGEALAAPPKSRWRWIRRRAAARAADTGP